MPCILRQEYYVKMFKAAQERYDYFLSMASVQRASLQILSALHPARSACSGFVGSKEAIEQRLSDAEAQSFRIRSMVQQLADRNLSSNELFEMAAESAFADRAGECPICFECPLDDPLQTPCRHLFCRECILEILELKNECPLCRATVHGMSALKQPADPQSAGGHGDGQRVSSSSPPEDGEEMQNGDGIRFDAKMKRLVVELERIRRDRPNEKSLIFTAFSKSLEWICSELDRNGFSYRTLSGSMTMNKRKKQLAQFANDGSVKVFVLTVRAGAVGITLTAANHVFMMEPTLNPALHRQAINRVYRLGQTKGVHIHTLIMRDSVEQRIWECIHRTADGGDDGDGSGGGGGGGGATAQRKGRGNIAGNINSDRRAKLDSSIIHKLFQNTSVSSDSNEQQ